MENERKKRQAGKEEPLQRYNNSLYALLISDSLWSLSETYIAHPAGLPVQLPGFFSLQINVFLFVLFIMFFPSRLDRLRVPRVASGKAIEGKYIL